MQEDYLENICTSHKTFHGRMRAMLSRWLQGQLGFNLFYESSFSTTWKNIMVADELEAKYCPSDMLLESTMQYNMALLELKMSVSVT